MWTSPHQSFAVTRLIWTGLGSDQFWTGLRLVWTAKINISNYIQWVYTEFKRKSNLCFVQGGDMEDVNESPIARNLRHRAGVGRASPLTCVSREGGASACEWALCCSKHETEGGWASNSRFVCGGNVGDVNESPCCSKPKTQGRCGQDKPSNLHSERGRG